MRAFLPAPSRSADSSFDWNADEEPQSVASVATASRPPSDPDSSAEVATRQSILTAGAVAGLFLLIVLLQRFSVPGLTQVPLLLPVVYVWAISALVTRVAVINNQRLMLWLGAAGVTVLVIPLQMRWVDDASVSIGGWALFMTIWLPFVLELRDRRSATYVLALRYIAGITLALALLTIVMFVSQFAGVPYRDWFGDLVPQSFQLGGFVITYPVEYGSSIYRANGWIGLEPSMVSFQLGLGALAAVIAGVRSSVVLVIAIAMVCTISGSGFAIAAVGLVVLLLHPVRSLLRRYTGVAILVGIGAATTSVGSVLLARVTEIQSNQSSASLRAVEPYAYMWPAWTSDLTTVLLGSGPGSSQDFVDDTGILGLLVPSPVKIFFEYGLIAGSILAAVLLLNYYAGPSRAFAASLLGSLWLLQPGTTTTVIVAPVLVFVTLWSPRADDLVEHRVSAGAESG